MVSVFEHSHTSITHTHTQPQYRVSVSAENDPLMMSEISGGPVADLLTDGWEDHSAKNVQVFFSSFFLKPLTMILKLVTHPSSASGVLEQVWNHSLIARVILWNSAFPQRCFRNTQTEANRLSLSFSLTQTPPTPLVRLQLVQTQLSVLWQLIFIGIPSSEVSVYLLDRRRLSWDSVWLSVCLTVYLTLCLYVWLSDCDCQSVWLKLSDRPTLPVCLSPWTCLTLTASNVKKTACITLWLFLPGCLTVFDFVCLTLLV